MAAAPWREAASACGTGGSKEPQQPHGARETNPSLHCPVALKPQPGRGGGRCPHGLALEPGQRSTGPAWRGSPPAQGRGHSTRACCPWLGTQPSLQDTGDHVRNSSIGQARLLWAMEGRPAGHCVRGLRRPRPRALPGMGTAAPQDHGRMRGTWMSCRALGCTTCLLPKAGRQPKVDTRDVSLESGPAH